MIQLAQVCARLLNIITLHLVLKCIYRNSANSWNTLIFTKQTKTKRNDQKNHFIQLFLETKIYHCQNKILNKSSAPHYVPSGWLPRVKTIYWNENELHDASEIFVFNQKVIKIDQRLEARKIDLILIWGARMNLIVNDQNHRPDFKKVWYTY